MVKTRNFDLNNGKKKRWGSGDSLHTATSCLNWQTLNCWQVLNLVNLLENNLALFYKANHLHVLKDNHDGMITHLEPDIQECEVKWALENITMNKASASRAISNPER